MEPKCNNPAEWALSESGWWLSLTFHINLDFSLLFSYLCTCSSGMLDVYLVLMLCMCGACVH